MIANTELDVETTTINGKTGQVSYELTTYAGRSYSFDADGYLQTMTVDGTGAQTQYEYDGFGGLRSVSLPNGSVVTYEHDAQHHRVAKRVNGTLSDRFVYGTQSLPVAQVNEVGQVVAYYIYAERSHVPSYIERFPTDQDPKVRVYRVVSDHLGSVRLVMDVGRRAIVQRIDYDEFGRVTADTSPGFQPFGFAGGLYDADTGLVRFGARDYDALTGRWTAKDPILFRGGSANLYAYCNNDPMNYLDPSGRDALAVANWLESAGGMDLANGVRSYGEGLGTAAAHLAAKAGLFGEPEQRYASNVDAVIGAAATAAMYLPDQVSELARDELNNHPAFIGGRLATGSVCSTAVTLGTGVSSLGIGLAASFLSSYGLAVQSAEQGAGYVDMVRDQFGGLP